MLASQRRAQLLDYCILPNTVFRAQSSAGSMDATSRNSFVTNSAVFSPMPVLRRAGAMGSSIRTL